MTPNFPQMKGKENMLRTRKPPEPIRLLTIITQLELGGAQQVVLNTLRGLDPAKYQRYLLAGRGGQWDNQGLNLPGVRVYLWKTFKHPIRIFWDVVTVLRLYRLIKRLRIQIVHTHSSKAGLLGRLAARLAKVPVVIHTVHGWPFHPYQAAGWRWCYIRLERMAAKWSTRLIAVSAATREQGLRAGIGKHAQYMIIYPASDLEAFRPATSRERVRFRKEFQWSGTTPVVGMVACLKPQKAVLDFIRAAKWVVEQRPDTRFLLVGDGEERKQVEAEIKRLGLEKKVIMAGWREDVPRLLPGFDVLALSSLWEGLPCVLAQAMKSGVPIAATDVAGTREALQQGKNGELVPPQKPKALAEAILKLLTQPSCRKRVIQASKAQAKKFAMKTMIQSVERLYQQEFPG